MARGGFREKAGRKSLWVSSSKTALIRVPEWMVKEVLNFAQKLDTEENIKEEESKSKDGGIVEEIIEKWKKKSMGKEESPRWKNLSNMIEEIEREMMNN
jgi:hypothetical protein